LQYFFENCIGIVIGNTFLGCIGIAIANTFRSIVNNPAVYQYLFTEW